MLVLDATAVQTAANLVGMFGPSYCLVFSRLRYYILPDVALNYPQKVRFDVLHIRSFLKVVFDKEVSS